MKHKKPLIAIFALQGAFIEHQRMMEKLGAEAFLVRSLADVRGKTIDGVILPGGESTTMKKLLAQTGLGEWLQEEGKKGMPIFGTCAGLILLADFGLLDVTVDRNAYGSQLDSFEDTVVCNFGNGQFEINGIFIRAPKITSTGEGVEILARYKNIPVLVKQGNVIAASFHPELTKCDRIHRFFLTKAV